VFVTLVYLNHFDNEFHFDDFHTIVQNPYITDIHSIPAFFADAKTMSVLPANRVWRPMVFVSLAVDYWLGHAMKPFWFHATTFFWLLVQLGLMFAVFRAVLDRTRPDSRNVWVAAFATSVFAVHPAVAETVNYIIQRADIYSTLGVVAALAAWIYFPALRKYGLYLLPLAFGVLSKPPAMVFPVILFLYIWLFEEESPKAALRKSVPSLAVVGALAWLSSAMTPDSFTPGAFSDYAYRITQPIVIFRYFRTFFIPTGLTADTDRTPVNSIFEDTALAGLVFVLALIGTAFLLVRSRRTKPIAFGLFWFLLAVLPTSAFPLAEVENDHRMYFPFVGLTLGVSWTAALWLYDHPVRREWIASFCALVLLALGAGTWQRNRVWRTEESLWYDVTLKSPHNGRGLMNYGLTQMQKGETARALDYFQRALVYNPGYSVLEVNLGVANGALRNDQEAEKHFVRAIELAPAEANSHFYYARWLNERGRQNEAIAHLSFIIANNPTFLDAPHLLMSIYGQEANAELLKKAATETLERFPSDAEAHAWLARADSLKPTPETYLSQSLALYQQGKYDQSIQAAREALKLRPNYSEAWNNIAAAFNSESKWDEAIQAGQQAVLFNPESQLARNNLNWSMQQKARTLMAKNKTFIVPAP
jgi:tetratricopeptide (TPR) repeat protein